MEKGLLSELDFLVCNPLSPLLRSPPLHDVHFLIKVRIVMYNTEQLWLKLFQAQSMRSDNWMNISWRFLTRWLMAATNRVTVFEDSIDFDASWSVIKWKGILFSFFSYHIGRTVQQNAIFERLRCLILLFIFCTFPKIDNETRSKSKAKMFRKENIFEFQFQFQFQFQFIYELVQKSLQNSKK
jgi:hypothetical protein